jgi:hypothetical protein
MTLHFYRGTTSRMTAQIVSAVTERRRHKYHILADDDRFHCRVQQPSQRTID